MYSRESEAQRWLLILLIGGLLLTVLGAAIAVGQWPDDSAVYDDDGGSPVIAYGALALSALGQLGVFVSLVGWGVGLGIRWSGLSDIASDAAGSARALAAGTDPGRAGLSGLEPLDPPR